MLRRLFAAQREVLAVTVVVSLLVGIFLGGGWEQAVRTLMITSIYAGITGNLMRLAGPRVGRWAMRFGTPLNYLLLTVSLAGLGAIGAGLSASVLSGINEAMGLFTPSALRVIARMSLQLSVLVSVIVGIVTTLAERRRAELEQTIEQQEAEFQRAKEIQVGLLPASLPALPGYLASGHWKPARSVGGDYYDLWLIPDGAAGLCMADVSGKGAAAALLMANLQAAVKVTATTRFSPADLCFRLNRVLKANLGRGRFVTMFVADLDLATHRLTYANAGHNPPLLLRRSGVLEELKGTGPALGVLSTARYREASVVIEPGDRLLLFTDGLPEAGIEAGAPLGEEGVAEALRYSPDPQALIRGLESKVEGKLHDDVTMLALYRLV
ncbi:MAG: PP2C family protein-serine/threonine phosphatase [Bryobacteraceae bacterium]|nr:PP2C family protein-serine/threonine phosphatase [Bryobacteraceae bacterium]